jgi:hypothetical protein
MLLRYFLNDFEMVSVALLLLASLFFCIPQTLYFCCKVFIFYNLFSLFLCHISVS